MLLTLTTDFGAGSPYVAAMKGVILSINPTRRSSTLRTRSRRRIFAKGAMVLAEVTPLFPPGHDARGGRRSGRGHGAADRLCARSAQQQYLAPDNGLLSLLARRTPAFYDTDAFRAEFWRQSVSATFHGRDIMAPVAAQLSLGLDPELLGPPQAELVHLDWPEARAVPEKSKAAISRDRLVRQPDHQHHGRAAGRRAHGRGSAHPAASTRRSASSAPTPTSRR